MLNTTQYILAYGIFFSAALVFSLIISSLLLKFATNLGIRNNTEGMIRWSPTVRPSLGGFVFYIVFLLSIVFYLIVFAEFNPLNNLEFLGLVLTCTMGFLMGMADDAYNTKPWLKFAVQFACGIVLIATGNSITFFHIPAADYALTLFWVVGIMNSVNMLDNMDGVTGSNSLLIMLAMLAYLLLRDQLNSFYFVVLVGVVASLLGFLYYNWNPAKMYMGDTGSQFLGAFLSALGIRICWNGMDISGAEVQTKQLLYVALLFIVPLSDTTTVSINRMLKGKSPFVGGKDHTTHHLAYMGLKDRHVPVLLGALTIATAAVALGWVYTQTEWSLWQFGLCCALVLLLFGALYSTTRLKKKSDG